MPYIKREDREKFAVSVSTALIELLKTENETEAMEKRLTANPGELNFIISKIVWKLFDICPSYANANMLMGVLESVKAEFYRRKVAPYEDKKIEENGDL